MVPTSNGIRETETPICMTLDLKKACANHSIQGYIKMRITIENDR